MELELYSEYYKTLDGKSKARYAGKLKYQNVQLIDPYADHCKFIDNVTKWPNLNYFHLSDYLINSPGQFTNENLQAHKSLQAWRYYEEGKVQTVLIYDVDVLAGLCFLKALVQPSQRVSTPISQYHRPWVLVDKKNTRILTAHCTCMAGLSEVCSHVAAILFKVEAAVRLGYTEAPCTSIPCTWNQQFQKNVTPAPFKTILMESTCSKEPSKKSRQSLGSLVSIVFFS